MNARAEVQEAANRIRDYVRQTPVEESPTLSRLGGCQVSLKLENYQLTGSFKVRGAMSRLLAMTPEERRRGFVAASTGNHGAAVAYARRVLDCSGFIVVPEDAAPAKIEAIRAYGAEVVVHGADCVIAERFARRRAAERRMVYLSPYNDPRVIGGQGTIAVELSRQLERIDTVYVAVGGGGLISGVASWLKGLDPEVEIVGCSPVNSAVMIESLRAGEILELESQPTLSDGTAGGVEEGAITFELCRRYIDRCVLVSESEIERAMKLVIEHHHMLIEGAAAVAVAAFLKDSLVEESARPADKNVVIILCGANVGIETLRRIL
ncbi:MAG: threonine/serine dehydratase [bacterium]|nr:threonine/serine dehydratase [bacterium]